MVERLHKFLARAGVASRRSAEKMIEGGRVAVNERIIVEQGTKVDPRKDRVTVDGKRVELRESAAYYVLYKPPSVVTTMEDPQGRPTVVDYLRDVPRRLFPVGRLDYDAEGALLLTDDGSLAHRLAHPSFRVPRTYLAKVKGRPDDATIDRLRRGVRLEDGPVKPISVNLHARAEKNTWLAIVVAEGRPHLIKRLCEAVGHPVVRLFRPSYAGVSVEGLRPGQLRPLRAAEVNSLMAVSAGAMAPERFALKLPARRHRARGSRPEPRSDSEAPPSRSSRRPTDVRRPRRRRKSH